MVDGRVIKTASELVDQLVICPRMTIICDDLESRAVMDTVDDLLTITTDTLKFRPGEPVIPLRLAAQQVAADAAFAERKDEVRQAGPDHDGQGGNCAGLVEDTASGQGNGSIAALEAVPGVPWSECAPETLRIALRCSGNLMTGGVIVLKVGGIPA